MRTILIPTDFTVESLLAIKKTLQANDGDDVKIILFHCIALSDSITDLLTFSKARKIRELSSKAFIDACEIMRNKYAGGLKFLGVELFTGVTNSAFRNFVEAHEADVICMLDGYEFKMPSKYSIDPSKLLKNANIPVFKMVVEIPKITVKDNELAVLFSA